MKIISKEMGAALLNSHPICNNTFGLALSGFVPVFTRSVNSPHPTEMTVMLGC